MCHGYGGETWSTIDPKVTRGPMVKAIVMVLLIGKNYLFSPGTKLLGLRGEKDLDDSDILCSGYAFIVFSICFANYRPAGNNVPALTRAFQTHRSIL